MKAIIQAIIREISALSLPMAPELVLDVFTRYPEPVSTSLPNDLIAICTQLDVVKKLAQQGRELQMKIKDLELHKKNLELHNKEVEDYSKEGIVLQHQLSLLEDDLQKLQDSISSTRAELTELYNLVIKEMQKDQFTISETVPESITHKQLTNIVDIFNQLVSEFRRLNLPLAKLDLLKLKKQQSELVSQMNKHLHINGLAIALPKENNLNLWKLLQSNLTHSIQKWKDLKPKLDSLQEEFATCLSTSDAQRKISTLENNKVKLVNELNQLAQQIKLHELRPEIQRELTVQFQQSSSVDEQLKNYETKIDSFLAYVDPHSWLEWYQNKPQYTKQQKEYSQRLSFLTLLKEQKEKIVHLDELIASIDVLTKITNSNLMSLETENLLISQAIILLNELPQCKVPLRFDKFTAADYYILLIDNIFLVPESIRKDENLLALVNEFLPVLIKIVEYREKYTLLVEQDSYIPTIEELQQVVPEEIIIEQKRKQLQTCQLG